MSIVTGVIEFIAVLVVYYIRFHKLPFAAWMAAVITGAVGGTLLFYLLRIGARGSK